MQGETSRDGTDEARTEHVEDGGGTAPRPLTPAAARALAEAAERRRAIDARAAAVSAAPERLGRGGLEPVRYDDWEVKGLAVDF
ncbi:DUF1674 domain-containing protein [Methylobacterium sp. E-041]|jgi:hypothetical protein|uniref:DUF1674 domain-containing protein n=1 Tax=unclassified Methylobacterium TaxID=2615210 RepID=UPI0011C6FEB5|nr:MULTISPECIES: DUF1674 domain-containing protein [unclassified Methylobacterium]RZK80078.1 MAG: DUF1674 domain-containing protein [Methylobacterium sp.]MCJ2075236.1 DUF1674 domain-containing protein [Methylobacterium sp. E-016]MCJ2108440.1 DUF1674 domain-containing protein [Methylobacterium sp. E-041]TXN50333.1 DUF1674 domain-containing protein [Methylobacterium sp. WL119]TXN63289.1 DUF1674 domain-containing protein [Methylobacterium sp. WL30]